MADIQVVLGKCQGYFKPALMSEWIQFVVTLILLYILGLQTDTFAPHLCYFDLNRDSGLALVLHSATRHSSAHLGHRSVSLQI